MQHHDSPAVTIAHAHIEAWSHQDWDKARGMLAPDVQVMTMTTHPNVVATDLSGIDKYMEGLLTFARAVEPGSARIIASAGDDQNALILVSVKADFGQGTVTLQGARLYLLDEHNKITAKQVVFFVLAD